MSERPEVTDPNDKEPVAFTEFKATIAEPPAPEPEPAPTRTHCPACGCELPA